MRRPVRMALLALVAAVAVTMAACSGGDASGGGEQAAGAPVAAAVMLSDFAIEPANIEVPAGSAVVFTVMNHGQTPHTFGVVVGGQTIQTDQILGGDTAELRLPALDAGRYDALCTIPGHADLGMVATVTATAGGASAATPTGVTGAVGHSTMSAEEMSASHKAGVDAFLAGNQTSTQGNQPVEPTIENGVKVFELTAENVQWEISKGVTKEAMAFNGQIPGPEIRVSSGDHVRVVLQNQLDQPTTLHFHGLTVPNEADGVTYVTQDPIMPGGYYTYEFTIKDPPGMYVYHSHFNSTEQVGKGLFGALIVEPEGGSWRSVYGVEPGVETDLFLADGPLDYTLNGKSFPATTPIVAEKGQWILIHMANDGSLLHPMHLHGFHFLVVGEDGFPLARQNRYMADTLVIAPGSRFDILVHAVYPGAWAFHCHTLPHVEGPEGMFGMVTAVVVQ